MNQNIPTHEEEEDDSDPSNFYSDIQTGNEFAEIFGLIQK